MMLYEGKTEVYESFERAMIVDTYVIRIKVGNDEGYSVMWAEGYR